MSSQTVWRRAVNYGRPEMDGPINTDWIYRDPDITLPVQLHSYRKVVNVWIPPASRHWSLAWVVDGGSNHQNLHVKVERGYHHYTYWGAFTSSIGPLTTDTDCCIITNAGRLTLAQRGHLEQLALRVQVWEPNGVWNCQSWMMVLFQLAINCGPFHRRECEGRHRVCQRKLVISRSGCIKCPHKCTSVCISMLNMSVFVEAREWFESPENLSEISNLGVQARTSFS